MDKLEKIDRTPDSSNFNSPSQLQLQERWWGVIQNKCACLLSNAITMALMEIEKLLLCSSKTYSIVITTITSWARSFPKKSYQAQKSGAQNSIAFQEKHDKAQIIPIISTNSTSPESNKFLPCPGSQKAEQLTHDPFASDVPEYNNSDILNHSLFRAHRTWNHLWGAVCVPEPKNSKN